MKRRVEQNKRVEAGMRRRLGKAHQPPILTSAAGQRGPRVFVCKCNHAIDLTAGFEQCPKCGSPLQFTLPLPSPKPRSG